MSTKNVCQEEATNNPNNSQASEPLLDKTVNSTIENGDKENSSDEDKALENLGKRLRSVAIIEAKHEKKMGKWQLVPPDGGWGWLILIGSTLVNLLIPGTIKSFGVLFVEFLETFDSSPAAAAWIPALCYFLYSSLGPVSSLLSVKYSYRTVTLMGGTFAAAGMILSYFADSVTYLCISYGVLVGTGAGLSFPPTVYIVTSYFLRLRGLANGICISGSALGSIVLPPILRILLETFGYRGAILIMGGVTLNVWVAALVYDPVDKHMKKVPVQQQDDLEASSPQPRFVISGDNSMASLPHIPHNDSFIDNFDLSSNNFNRSASSAAVPNLKSQSRERKVSAPSGRHEIMRVKVDSAGNVTSSSALHSVPERGNPAMDMFSHARLPNSRRHKVPKKSPSTSSFQYVTTPYHGSTLTLQPEIFASSFSLGSLGKSDGKKPEANKIKFFDLQLLKDPIYLIILISNATNAIGYTNFIILLPSYALSLGFDKNSGALLLSIVSAFDLIGRIGGSALSDLQLCPKAAYFIGGLLISGISLALLPFFADYALLSVCCGVFGLASGTYVGITAVIMAHMLGEERLQATYGISLFVNGVLQLIGPPLCGIWFQVAKSYVGLFCFLGIVLITGSSLWGLVPFVKKTKSDEAEDDDENVE